MDSETSRVCRKQWTVEDKTNLLRALEKYGPTDLNSISKEMVNKSQSSIKLMIHKMKQKARLANRHECNVLDAWLESGLFADASSPIPQALRFIALFEKHPCPEESGGFHFRAAYDFLHRTTLGLPPLDLPEETSAILDDLVERTRREVWPSSEDDVLDYVRTLDRKRHSLKCYPPMSKMESRKMIVPD